MKLFYNALINTNTIGWFCSLRSHESHSHFSTREMAAATASIAALLRAITRCLELCSPHFSELQSRMVHYAFERIQTFEPYASVSPHVTILPLRLWIQRPHNKDASSYTSRLDAACCTKRWHAPFQDPPKSGIRWISNVAYSSVFLSCSPRVLNRLSFGRCFDAFPFLPTRKVENSCETAPQTLFHHAE